MKIEITVTEGASRCVAYVEIDRVRKTFTLRRKWGRKPALCVSLDAIASALLRKQMRDLERARARVTLSTLKKSRV